MSQPYLIQQIIEQAHITKANKRATPAKVSEILKKNRKVWEIIPDFNYKSLIEKQNYLERSTHYDITYASYQCTCFSAYPKFNHCNSVW